VRARSRHLERPGGAGFADRRGSTVLHNFAFRSREIKAAPALDREEAKALIDYAVAVVNQVWGQRACIEPRYDRRTPPNLMQIYRLLPRTNCGQCGCSTYPGAFGR